MTSSSDDETAVNVAASINDADDSKPVSSSKTADNYEEGDDAPASGKRSVDVENKAAGSDESQYERSRAKIAIIMLALGVSTLTIRRDFSQLTLL